SGARMVMPQATTNVRNGVMLAPQWQAGAPRLRHARMVGRDPGPLGSSPRGQWRPATGVGCLCDAIGDWRIALLMQLAGGRKINSPINGLKALPALRLQSLWRVNRGRNPASAVEDCGSRLANPPRQASCRRRKRDDPSSNHPAYGSCRRMKSCEIAPVLF